MCYNIYEYVWHSRVKSIGFCLFGPCKNGGGPIHETHMDHSLLLVVCVFSRQLSAASSPGLRIP